MFGKSKIMLESQRKWPRSKKVYLQSHFCAMEGAGLRARIAIPSRFLCDINFKLFKTLSFRRPCSRLWYCLWEKTKVKLFILLVLAASQVIFLAASQVLPLYFPPHTFFSSFWSWLPVNFYHIFPLTHFVLPQLHFDRLARTMTTWRGYSLLTALLGTHCHWDQSNKSENEMSIFRDQLHLDSGSSDVEDRQGGKGEHKSYCEGWGMGWGTKSDIFSAKEDLLFHLVFLRIEKKH